MKENLLKDDEKYFKSLLDETNDYIDKYMKFNKADLIESRTVLGILNLEYHSSVFVELLAQEDYIRSEADAHTVMRMICAKTLEQFVQPLLKKGLDEKLLFINQHISSMEINQNHIFGDNLTAKYQNADFLIKGLTYDSISPLIIFEDFISYFNIKIRIDHETGLFQYRFTKNIFMKPPKVDMDKWFSAKNPYDMCEHFNKTLLDEVLFLITSSIEFDNNPITINLKDYMDITNLSNKNPQELYDYLKTYETARMALPLEYLYLLLNYKKFTVFKEEYIMDKIVKYLMETEPEPDEKSGYCFRSLQEVMAHIVKEEGA